MSTTVPAADRRYARSAAAVERLAAQLAATATRPWTLMEVCGGQTHAIVRWGLDQLLPEGIRLIHGPGCPVCVTPAATLDAALDLARQPEVILCSYGDMLRVPGSRSGDDLLGVRAAGGDVRLLTSPLQAIALAQSHPDRLVVFLAVGFETTAPATALLARQATALKLANLALLPAHVRVVPAMEAILSGPDNQVQGFLAAGHVGAVMGTAELQGLVQRQGVPVVISGFEPVELMAGILRCVQLLEAGESAVANAYGRVVQEGGNPEAQQLIEAVFEVVDQPWRGLGVIPAGGLALRPAYAALEVGLHRPQLLEQPQPAAAQQPKESQEPQHPSVCIAGQILRGVRRPCDCPAFGSSCTPEHPLGAPMVSSEGACAAYHRYRPN
ncbi:hydrogenase formation protein HypD [Synechococcus sp. CCY9201]|uniref:hydrogenase formation protein HypD n=1 Tax=unclassified Synechococcus TaxID=2626047 RepID=UPI002AD27812|nr:MULTISPECIES: hydrogenase formation protein HypD [unclassified Synechococcus]MEA5473047.1 hydrogenase formation protein HypD [Synechococcus sp. CCY9201]